MDMSSAIYSLIIICVVGYLLFPGLKTAKSSPFNKGLNYWIFKKPKPDPLFHIDKNYDDDDD